MSALYALVEPLARHSGPAAAAVALSLAVLLGPVQNASAAERVVDEVNRVPVIYSEASDCPGNSQVCLFEMLTSPKGKKRLEISNISCLMKISTGGSAVLLALKGPSSPNTNYQYFNLQYTATSNNEKYYIANSPARYRLLKGQTLEIVAQATSDVTYAKCDVMADRITYQ